jgi:uncharacterized protein (DUF1800 family)
MKRTLLSYSLSLLLLLSLAVAAPAVEVGGGGPDTDRVHRGLIAYYPFVGEVIEGPTASDGTDVASDVSGRGAPLDLAFSGEVMRLPGVNGVSIGKGGALIAVGASKLADLIRDSQALTIEVWAKAGNTTQSGPARLVSYSIDPYERNFTLGQDRLNAEVRFRTTSSSQNGSPYLKQTGAFNTDVAHYVVTYAESTLRLFHDGVPVKTEARSGTLDNWDPSAAFVVGNEATLDRSWQGEVYVVAVYDRALDENEVRRNFLVGHDLTTGGNPVANQAPEVDAGKDRTVLLPAAETALLGVVGDDGLPDDGLLIGWDKVSGPGDVDFDPANSLSTIARFSAPGEYRLALEASDGALDGSDEITVLVTDTSRVSNSLIAFYPFDEGVGDMAHDLSGFGGPLNLDIGGDTVWLGDRNGVALGRKSRLTSDPAGKLHQAILGSGEFTFEVWAKPGNLAQGGPARLVTISQDGYKRNFTLGQQGARAEVRLRTTASTENGSPYLRMENTFEEQSQHLVVTYGSGILSLYRDGVLLQAEPREGVLSNWDAAYPLLVGNEGNTERDWRGEVYLLAVYNRALSDAEVGRNYAVSDNLAGGGTTVLNQEPRVGVGADRTMLLPGAATTLRATATDDGLPGAAVGLTWRKVSGPGDITFDPPNATTTIAHCSTPGDYVVALEAFDGELTGRDELNILVTGTSRVDDGLIAFYPFDEGAGEMVNDLSGYQSPLNLGIGGDTAWLTDRNGVALGRKSRLFSEPADKLHQAITGTGEFSFEVWAKPGNLTQGGPARLVTISQDGYKRNVTLGQQGARAEVRLRTTEGTDNGSPYLRMENTFEEKSQHLVVTYGGGILSLYRDGVLLKAEPREGVLSNWDAAYPLLVGNEANTERDWRGEVYLLAIYNRALSDAEVGRNYAVSDNLAGGGTTVANTAPQVEAGPDKTVLLPTTTLSLFGNAEDDGLPGAGLAVEWTNTQGVSFASTNQLATVATFPGAGTYTLTLEASDGGLNDSDTLTVTVVESARVSRNLVAFYPLNEGFGETAQDQSGSGPPLPLALNENADWIGDRNGVIINKRGSLMSGPAAKLTQAFQAAEEFTVEVFAKPLNLTQGGPARLAGISWDAYKRNFMLGQQGPDAEIRLRTTESSQNGSPYLRVRPYFSGQTEHHVATLVDGMLCLYRNGEQVSCEPREGTLATWDPQYPLVLGNERTGDRTWYGEIYLAAAYDRALTPAEIQRNFAVGADLTGGGLPVANQAPDVDAGDDQTITPPNMTVMLAAQVADDGLPADSMTLNWTKISGPGTADFADPNSLETAVTFSEDGAYRLKLIADDGALTGEDEVVITVASSLRVDRGLIAYYPMTDSGNGVVLDQSNSGTPLNLGISGDVTRLAGSNGYRLGAKAKLQSEAAAKLHTALTASNAFTFEIWAKADNITQGGPARLFSYSTDPYNRNFTLGPQAEHLHIRLRTTASDLNGKPYLIAEQAASTLKEHYAATFDGSKLQLYRNGVLIQEETRSGDLSNWDPAHVLLIGNEATTNRLWLGEVYLAAVYDRSLSPPELLRNYLVGAEVDNGGMPVPNMQPQVNAGSDRMITLPVNSVALSSLVLDDGLPADALTYSWVQTGGPAGAVGFSNPNALHPTATFSADGDYLVQLQVSDGEHIVTDEVQVTVIPAWVPRMLDQATWGPTEQTIQELRTMTQEEFLAQQFSAPPSGYPDPVSSSSPSVLQYRFFHNGKYGQDQLRQRMAFALGQIFVVSANAVGRREQMTPYLRILDRHALGNFYDLMYDVTLSPTMGKFLDMVNNAKPGEDGIPPNENYARELLQLFTLGLDLLNPDGTPQTDGSGKPIPAYTEDTVLKMALALTGWTYPTQPGRTFRWPNRAYYAGPMIAFEEEHDQTAKPLLNGFVLPAGQTAQQDLEGALRHIFEHPNVGPFVSKQLIQHLVTSNPSPGYVARVASAFNNNGRGVRGDMQAVARAILLDPEAALVTPTGGHLREPVLFALSLLRALGAEVSEENRINDETRNMGQNLFYPPSVFNYFSQFYRIPDTGLLGPEFQINTASRALDRADFVYRVVTNRVRRGVEVDLSRFEAVADDPARLVDMVDIALFQGRMSAQLRQSILQAMTATDNRLTRAQNANYIAATSSEYQVQH